MLIRRVSVTNLNASHDVGPTGSNQAQIFAKDGKLYAQLQGQNAVELADLAGENAGSPVGTVISFGGASLPAGWLECNGDEVAAQYSDLNTVLNGLYGTGSNGRSLLPDLRGRMPIGAGTGSSLTDRSLGNTGGVEGVELTTAQLPSHSHAVTDSGHSHSLSDSGHSHTLNDSGHTHDVTDSSGHTHSIDGHTHSISNSSHQHSVNEYSAYDTTISYESGSSSQTVLTSLNENSYGSTGFYDVGDTNSTSLTTQSQDVEDITIDSGTTGISLDSNTTGITISSGSSNISVGNTGSGGEHDNMSPWLCLKFLIKT